MQLSRNSKRLMQLLKPTWSLVRIAQLSEALPPIRSQLWEISTLRTTTLQACGPSSQVHHSRLGNSQAIPANASTSTSRLLSQFTDKTLTLAASRSRRLWTLKPSSKVLVTYSKCKPTSSISSEHYQIQSTISKLPPILFSQLYFSILHLNNAPYIKYALLSFKSSNI
jgi:hypothetical protein